MKPITSKKKRPYSPGLAARGIEFPEYLIYLFKRLFINPKVSIDFSLESSATDFSLPYFLLTIKSQYKEIGNIDISLIGNFYDVHQKKMINIPFEFQDVPEIIESSETASIKLEPNIDFSNYLHELSRIKLRIEYGYMLLEKVRTVSYHSTWRFDLSSAVPALSVLE